MIRRAGSGWWMVFLCSNSAFCFLFISEDMKTKMLNLLKGTLEGHFKPEGNWFCAAVVSRVRHFLQILKYFLKIKNGWAILLHQYFEDRPKNDVFFFYQFLASNKLNKNCFCSIQFRINWFFKVWFWKQDKKAHLL